MPNQTQRIISGLENDYNNVKKKKKKNCNEYKTENTHFPVYFRRPEEIWTFKELCENQSSIKQHGLLSKLLRFTYCRNYIDLTVKGNLQVIFFFLISLWRWRCLSFLRVWLFLVPLLTKASDYSLFSLSLSLSLSLSPLSFSIPLPFSRPPPSFSLSLHPTSHTFYQGWGWRGWSVVILYSFKNRAVLSWNHM